VHHAKPAPINGSGGRSGSGGGGECVLHTRFLTGQKWSHTVIAAQAYE